MIVRDSYVPCSYGEGYVASPCWSIPVTDKNSKGGSHWFDAPARDHAWWQKKKKRVILYLHPQKGQEVGQVRTRTSQDIGGANVMNTFSKATLSSGEPLVWLSVFRPYDEGEDTSELASQIKTLVDNEGNVSAKIGDLRVFIAHDGSWQVKR